MRPQWQDYVKGLCGSYVLCSCGHVLKSLEEVREHWQQGHADSVISKEGIDVEGKLEGRMSIAVPVYRTSKPSMQCVIDILDTLVADMQANPVKTRMTAILITDLQKAAAFARETLRVEGEQGSG